MTPDPMSSLPQLKALRAYAKLDDASLAASKLPPTVYFSHTRHTLTVFDAHPKALFHFLVLPRLHPVPTHAAAAAAVPPTTSRSSPTAIRADGDGDGLSSTSTSLTDSAADLSSLRALLRRAAASADARARAQGTMRVLVDEAARLRLEIEREMLARHGFAWPVWVGFHAVPSMEHLHLHVISSDLIAPALKTKRHYNTFSPSVGFFIPLAEVRTWIDDDGHDGGDGGHNQDRLLAKVRRLTPEEYEPRLKEALVCFRCGETAKNMPALKRHLQEEFDVLRKRAVGRLKRKRETDSASASRGRDGSVGGEGRGEQIGKVAQVTMAQAKGEEDD